MTVPHDSRELLRLEDRNVRRPIGRKPAWIRIWTRQNPRYMELQLVRPQGLHTVGHETGRFYRQAVERRASA